MLNSEVVKNWRDPETKEKLILSENGSLTNMSGKEYDVNDGIPNLTKITDKDRNEYAISLFAKESGEYDDYHYLTYKLFKSNEDDVRNSIIDKLHIDGKKGIRVLELSAGTGRDSVLIKKRIAEGSELHVQDISLDMLKVLKNKFKSGQVIITQSNAEALPYPAQYFDAIYSYGGVGMSLYSDVKAQMKEIIRVTKPGARVVIAGRGLAPWLYDTEFGRILIDYNKHYMNNFSLEDIPVEARNVNLSWILHGVVYCMEFEVGEGEPDADFDFDIPGKRGGTLRTRYYGKLEGVSPETKRLAQEAREKLDISMYEFLNQSIQKAANDILGGGMKNRNYSSHPACIDMGYRSIGKWVA